MSIYDILVEIVKFDTNYFPPVLEVKTTITNNIKKKLPVLLYYSVLLHSSSYYFQYWMPITPPSGKKTFKHHLLLEDVVYHKAISEIGGLDKLFINVKAVVVAVGGGDIVDHSAAIEFGRDAWIMAQQQKKKPHGRGIQVSSAYEAMMRNRKRDFEGDITQISRFPTYLKLHPKIASASEKLFHNRHYSQAIFEAVKVLEKEIKAKSGIRDKSGVDLVNHAFNAEHPIIKIVEGEEQEQIDEREGFRFLYMGAFRGIKNPKSHSVQNLEDPAKALEYISFLSLLMKRLDESSN